MDLNELCDRAFKAEVQRCCGATAQWGFGVNEHNSEFAFIVYSLTQCLIQFCHLWMVPACSLGLMAVRRQENETKTFCEAKVQRGTFSGQIKK